MKNILPWMEFLLLQLLQVSRVVEFSGPFHHGFAPFNCPLMMAGGSRKKSGWCSAFIGAAWRTTPAAEENTR
jgi:hypothetical protein